MKLAEDVQGKVDEEIFDRTPELKVLRDSYRKQISFPLQNVQTISMVPPKQPSFSNGLVYSSQPEPIFHFQSLQGATTATSLS
jgi:hypothetical protein